MQKFENILFKFIYYLCAFLMFLMVTIIFSQVVARYIFHHSLYWSEEIGRYLFIWITFIGAALALREKAHVAIDSFVKMMPVFLQKVVRIIAFLAMLAFSLVMTYTGWNMLQYGTHQVSAATQMPMYYVYLVLPVSGLLIAFYILKNFYEEFKSGGAK